ncbi:MAG: hypothetical protein HY808_06765 [Nitrospirae bacterium]|nr:hypothetical protein [Nitrospirota bacterium]
MRINFFFLMIISLFFMLSGCGGGDPQGGGSVDAPAEGTLTIGLSSSSITDTSATTTTDTFCCLTVVVKDANDIPLRDVNISIAFPFAVPDSSGMVQLLDGNAKKNSPMSVTTDENGAYYLNFQYKRGGGASFKGDFLVTSGSLSATTTFEVKTEEASTTP